MQRRQPFVFSRADECPTVLRARLIGTEQNASE